ncbi:MAG: EamA family transporter [Elusimicrobia bacterium]|nr:EamA family transporter [Elusimicrobiota bacterium]MDE2509965.1 EamA family transporter [Elusimicrobiota bacterium]
MSRRILANFPVIDRPVALALAALGLWSTFAALAIRLRGVPPFLLLGCALTLGAAVGIRGLTFRGLRPGVLLLGVYGLFAYHLCMLLALRLAPPVEANLLNYLWPLLIVVLSPLIVPGTPLTARHVAGAALGFTGAALIILTGGRTGFSAGALPGYALATAAAVVWSTYSLMTKRFGGFSTSAVSVFCLVSGALALLCHALFEPRYLLSRAEAPSLLLIGLGPMGAAFYLWDRAMKDGDPRVIGTLAYLTPLISTALIAALGLGRLSAASAAAGALIVAGAALGAR